MLLVAFTSCMFISCSDDDDDNSGGTSGGNTNVTIGDMQANLNHAYWKTDDENADGLTEGKHLYQIELYNFDPYKQNPSVPSSISLVYISFEATGTSDRLPTGTFRYQDYDWYGVFGASESNNTGKYQIEDGAGSGDLVITQDGDTYTVTINPLKLDYVYGSAPTSSMTFTYKGKIKQVPTGF